MNMKQGEEAMTAEEREALASTLLAQISIIQEAIIEAPLGDYVWLGARIGFLQGYAAALRGEPVPEWAQADDENDD